MRILLVEDELKLANAVKRVLELQKYAVDVAYDGELGLDLAVGEEYDLIILDIMLPNFSGLEICKQVRQEKITTPILLLTAKGQISDKVTGLDVGADDYMVKPFSFEELFARIRALMRRAPQLEDVVLKIGDLVLNPITSKVTMGETEIQLSAKEYTILEYLMRHKNSIISKEQIVSHVWDYDADVLPSTVEVHVKHLRDKIDSPFNFNLIKTIRGFGYEISDK
ncbi:MAG: response regulator transcription factor [Candidatus Pacebacteria bacterium]|nr:response regulator transcription factor [Candidatus Paceibacterota bacterium]